MTRLIQYRGESIAGRMPPFKDFLRAANREGRKSETRRVIDPQPADGWAPEAPPVLGRITSAHPKRGKFGVFIRKGLGTEFPQADLIPCPYGEPGQLRVMPEPLRELHGYAIYADDQDPVISLTTGKPLRWRWKTKLLTSQYMPIEAGRFVVRILSIRVERLQDITEPGAKAEGAERAYFDAGGLIFAFPDRGPNAVSFASGPLPKTSFHAQKANTDATFIFGYRYLWEFINAKRGFPWASNPWVWAISYQQIP
jgi:hypothetical protein